MGSGQNGGSQRIFAGCDLCLVEAIGITIEVVEIGDGAVDLLGGHIGRQRLEGVPESLSVGLGAIVADHGHTGLLDGFGHGMRVIAPGGAAVGQGAQIDLCEAVVVQRQQGAVQVE